MDSNRYPDDRTFAIRLRRIFFEVARREEALQSYEEALTCGVPDPAFGSVAAPPMASVVTPIDSYRRRQAAAS